MTRKSRRRTFLRATMVAAAAGLAGCSDDSSGGTEEEKQEDTETEAEATTTAGGKDDTPTATEPPTDEPEMTETEMQTEQITEPEGTPPQADDPQARADGYLSNTDNYSGFSDERGTRTVTVTVGTEANGGFFGFNPPAIRVAEGTTVNWEWTGRGGAHNVVAEADYFSSGEPVSPAGSSFQFTFDEAGFHRYRCTNHADFGMRGVIWVQEEQTLTGYPTVDDWLENRDFDGRLEDFRGRNQVTVDVGAQGNGGSFAFDPNAIFVEPGTTVVWEWTGRGGSHSIEWENGEFNPSSGTSAAGNTYSITFEEEGVYLYECGDHAPSGGRGAVVVG